MFVGWMNKFFTFKFPFPVFIRYVAYYGDYLKFRLKLYWNQIHIDFRSYLLGIKI